MSLKAQENKTRAKQILFLGNSYTYGNNLPGILKSLAAADGKSIQTDQNTPGGYKLEQHLTNATSLQKINAKKWDHIILQDQSATPVWWPYLTTDAIKGLCDKIRKDEACTNNVLLYMTWGRKDPMALDWGIDYEENQKRLTDTYNEAACLNGTEVAPVGIAWKKVRNEGDPINLYSGDGSHASYAGSYLAACVFYASVYDESPVGNTFKGSLSEANAKYLQTKAYEAYKEYTELRMLFRGQQICDFLVDYAYVHEWHKGIEEQLKNESLTSIDFPLNIIFKGKHPTGNSELQAIIKQKGVELSRFSFPVSVKQNVCSKEENQQLSVKIPKKNIPYGEVEIVCCINDAQANYLLNDTCKRIIHNPVQMTEMPYDLTLKGSRYEQDFENLEKTDDWKINSISSLSDEVAGYEGNKGAFVRCWESPDLSSCYFKVKKGKIYTLSFLHNFIDNNKTSYALSYLEKGDDYLYRVEINEFKSTTDTKIKKYSVNLRFPRDMVIQFLWKGNEISGQQTAFGVDQFVIGEAKKKQAITFIKPENKTYGDKEFSLTAIASSNLKVDFKLIKGNLSIKNNLVSILGAGEAIIQAVQKGDDEYEPAVSVNHTFMIQKAKQQIIFPSIEDKELGCDAFELKASASSKLDIGYEITGPAVLKGDLVHVTGVGLVKVKAKQLGNSNYLAAVEIERSFTVTKPDKKEQSITVEIPVNITYTDKEFFIKAEASSGLDLQFELKKGKGKLTGNKFEIQEAGDVTILISQAGNDEYKEVSKMVSLSITKSEQTINFVSVESVSYGIDEIQLKASASSNLPVVFKLINGPGSVVDNILKVNGAGSIELEAFQLGDKNFKQAISIRRTITINKAKQVISFDEISNKKLGDSDFDISASSSSGLEVEFKAQGPVTLSGTKVHINGAGKVRIEALQSGNDNYEAANSVVREFVIETTNGIGESLGNSINIYPNPTSNFITVDCSLNNIELINLLNKDGVKLKTFAVSENSIQIDLSDLSSGIYFLQMSVGDQFFTKKLVKH